MPLSWNEIRDRAIAFSRDWCDVESERAEAQSFWNDFFRVFGIERRRVAVFEEHVKLSRAGERLRSGRIDAFWKGTLLVEHKSAGEDLDRAFAQATDYFDALPERDLPRYILTSDFRRLRLHDLESGQDFEFALKDFHRHVRRFGFIAGYSRQEIKEQDPVNIEAAEQMGLLHDRLKASGYQGHPLEVLLVRLVFCLFADDTGIFPRQAFRDFIENRSAADGSDLGAQLARLFQVLNTADSRRQKALDEDLAALPYVNGKLFEETLAFAEFDSGMREALLDGCALDWGAVSPAIFGALFQSIMDEKARRNLGAHYTSERNILKLIKPLFLDELWEEFRRIRRNRNKLFEFHKRLRELRFFDPACGCGNFLVITYRELRLLELEILRVLLESGRQQEIDIHRWVSLNVDRFYGIEIEEFPVQVTQLALWLADHQMNLKVSEEFGQYFARIPLQATPTIVQGNALRMDWNDVLPAEQASYLLSNPPFVGAKFMSDSQRTETAALFADIDSGGLLDYVACWYVKAAAYLKGTTARAAFVSTNSITQGEQVGVLWGWLLRQRIKIHFAHRTFQWSNEARGVAAVHCVIVGFGYSEAERKTIFEYDDIRGEPHAVEAANINPYLVDAPDLVLNRRSNPLCDVPEIGIGNKPIDDGNYLFTKDERRAFLEKEPQAAKYFRRWMGAEEFLNGQERWCLWLGDCPPEELRQMPGAMKRVEAVRRSRLASKSAPTRKLAETPTRFHVEFMPAKPFLVIPEVSSERRTYIPLGFVKPSVLASNKLRLLPSATTFHFGVLSSAMHMAWTRYTSGRLKSDFQYSITIVYNNFPWPKVPSEKAVAAIESAARAVLDARAHHPGSTLADLYDPLTMPAALVKAHHTLDRAVDAAYGRKAFASEAERVAFLFKLYQKYAAPLLTAEPATRRRRPPNGGGSKR
jgi:hypothetical protein